MKEKIKIPNCKCGSEAILQKNDHKTLVRVKCSSCDRVSEYECISDEAIRDWERKNK